MNHLMGRKTTSLYQYTFENKQSMSAQVLTCLQKTQQHQSAVTIKTCLSIYVSIAESHMLMSDSRADWIIHFRPFIFSLSFMVNP